MRALKTAQFTWIFIDTVSHTYKILFNPSEFSQVLTLLTANTFSETATVTSEYRDVCKSRFWCILMVVVKRVYAVFLEAVGKFDNRFGLTQQLKKHCARAGTIHKQLP